MNPLHLNDGQEQYLPNKISPITTTVHTERQDSLTCKYRSICQDE